MDESFELTDDEIIEMSDVSQQIINSYMPIIVGEARDHDIDPALFAVVFLRAGVEMVKSVNALLDTDPKAIELLAEAVKHELQGIENVLKH